MSADYQSLLVSAAEATQCYKGQGKVADYIPSLATVEPDRFGIAAYTLEGQSCRTGDAGIGFSIQSISKVFVLALVFNELGGNLWERVGREPSGGAFKEPLNKS